MALRTCKCNESNLTPRHLPCTLCDNLSPFDAYSIEQIRNAALEGCELCQLIKNITTRFVREEAAQQSLLISPFRWSGMLSLDNHDSTTNVICYKGPGTSFCWKHIQSADDVAGIGSVDGAVKFVNKRLQECFTQHQDCTWSRTAQLPKRTVFVGDNNDDIRLQENYRGQEARYLALSHCWGTGHAPPKTTSATISYSRHKILWRSLSKTFKDAIELTRELGIQHVWIDSLCIIQDDNDDWVRESGSMASIYANSLLTISAAASEDGRGGLFRNPPVEIFTIRDSDGIPTILYARRDEISEDLPLMKRGWAFQERLLSPRLIHFTSTELVWECETSSTCECGLLGRESEVINLHYGLPRHAWRLDKRQLQGALRSGNNLHYDPWPTIVERYSNCQLTKVEDKLPALSGLAQETQKRYLSRAINPGRYPAGMWEFGLLHQLHWFQESHAAPVIKGGTVAPSWSWASVTGKTTIWDDGKAGNLFEASITSSHCFLSTEDPYGQASGEFLDLSTVLILAKFPAREYLHTHGQLTIYREDLEESDYLMLYMHLDTRTEWQRHVIRRQHAVSESLFVYGAVLSYGSKRFAMLLLEEVPGPVRNFRRVGIAFGYEGQFDTV